MGIKEEKKSGVELGVSSSGVETTTTPDFSSVEGRQAAVQRMFQEAEDRMAQEEEYNFASNDKQWDLARWVMGQLFELNHQVIFERILRESKKKTFSSTSFEGHSLKPVEMIEGQEFFLSAQQASSMGKFDSVLHQALQECFADKALVVGLRIRSETVEQALRLYFSFKLYWGRFVTEAPSNPQVSLDSRNFDLFSAARRLRDGSGWEHGSLVEYVSKLFPSDIAVQMAVFEAAKAARDSTSLDLISDSYNSTCSFFTQMLGLATVNAAMARELTRRYPNLVFSDVLLEADERYIPCRLRLRATVSWD